MKRFLFLHVSLFSLNAVKLDDLACPTPQPVMRPQVVAIRSMVSVFELTQVIGVLIFVLPEKFSMSMDSIVASMNAVEAVMPLANRKAELLEKFGRQDLKKALEYYAIHRNLQEAFSPDLCHYICCICDSNMVMVESFYKNNKITAGQKDILFSAYTSVKTLFYQK